MNVGKFPKLAAKISQDVDKLLTIYYFFFPQLACVSEEF